MRRSDTPTVAVPEGGVTTLPGTCFAHLAAIGNAPVRGCSARIRGTPAGPPMTARRKPLSTEVGSGAVTGNASRAGTDRAGQRRRAVALAGHFRGRGPVDRAVRRPAARARRRPSRPTSNAPRGALLYPRRSREGLGGGSLGLMAYRDPKGERDKRMPEKRRSSPGVRGGARETRAIWRRLDRLISQSPEDVKASPPERHPRPAPCSVAAS